MSNTGSPSVLVVGGVNIDLVTRVTRCPKPGETVIGRSFETIPGGKGANQAVTAARLGAKTWLGGCVGADSFGELQRNSLSAEGIDLTYLKTHDTDPTGTAIIFVAEEGENVIVVVPAANFGLLPADIEAMAGLFTKLDAVVMQLESRMETVEATLKAARKASVLSVLDAGPAQKVPQQILELADIVSPNETEAEAITGLKANTLEEARKCAGRLIETGAREVVLKLGAKGALYMSIDEWFHVPAFEVNAIDTVAAGDAFTAALAVAWRKMHRRDAIRFANAAGALATLTPGAQPSMPTLAAVEAFLRERTS
ncbi:MAG: ribokinase [Candidatus Hydrogenedentes bacterium]|nr:ribokinase [Candidatus Hydrogenedentota bacterium]